MNPQENTGQQPGYDPKQRVSNDLSVMQPGEVVICKIKRHPIGILGIYITMGLILTIIAVLGFGVFPRMAPEGTNSDQIISIAAVLFFIMVVIFAVYGFIATKVYWGNSWIVTSDSVTQITQSSLFNRQSSQLALASIEDITAEQNGILTHIFNYGVLKAETAGHREKFVFTYCPNPNFYAKKILEAREAFEMGGHRH